MKFLVPNYSCFQNPSLGGYRPSDPRSLCPLSSTEFVEPPPNKIPGYATERDNLLCRHIEQYTPILSVMFPAAAVIKEIKKNNKDCTLRPCCSLYSAQSCV